MGRSHLANATRCVEGLVMLVSCPTRRLPSNPLMTNDGFSLRREAAKQYDLFAFQPLCVTCSPNNNIHIDLSRHVGRGFSCEIRGDHEIPHRAIAFNSLKLCFNRERIPILMQLSLFSVSYAGFWGQHQLSLPDFIARAAQFGYDSVMLAGKRPHLSPLDAGPDHIALVKTAMQENNIRCGVIAGYTDLSPTAAAEVPYVEMQIAYVESLAKIASELDAPIVRVFTAYEVDGQSPHAAWENVVRAIQEMCDRAEPYGVTIAVQNHHDVCLHTDALLEMLDDVDRKNCKLGFDAWSPALRGEALYDVALKMAPHTVITTSADYVRFPRYRYHPEVINYTESQPDMVRAVPFGEGFIDYEAFFSGLADGGFDGIATFEMCSPLRGGGGEQNLDHCSRTYVQWMQAHEFASPAAAPADAVQES